MATPSKRLIEDLRGLTKLAITATTNTTDLVENMHHNIAVPSWLLGESQASRTGGITGMVYGTVRGVTKLVGGSLDLAMGAVVPFLDGSEPPSRTRDNFLSVINGVYGDRLTVTNNSLALQMSLFHNNVELQSSQLSADSVATLMAAPAASPAKLMVFVHGLCMNRHGWEKDQINHSRDLAEALGYVPLYLNYNTGQSIVANGAAFAEQLEALLAGWPNPVADINIIGHSMGGLVTRSACHYGEKNGHCWPALTKRIASIGTPHHGAPLERGGKMLDDLLTRSSYAVPFTRLTQLRSVGIENLRYGYVGDVETEFVQLPSGIEYFAIAGVLNKQSNAIAENTLGDGLVPLNSALGQHKDATRVLAVENHRKWVAYNMGHNEMLCHPDVFAQLKKWLA